VCRTNSPEKQPVAESKEALARAAEMINTRSTTTTDSGLEKKQPASTR